MKKSARQNIALRNQLKLAQDLLKMPPQVAAIMSPSMTPSEARQLLRQFGVRP